MNIQIIAGSTRQGRMSPRVAKWVEAELRQQPDVQVEIVDLHDYQLPMLDEAISPRYNPDRAPEGVVKQWLDKLAQADGYVVVSPEYNRSMPGALKNALDHIDFQLDDKPVALVTYGSTGGAQALANLRMAIPGLNAFTVPSPTFLTGFMDKLFDEAGKPIADVSYQQGVLQGMLKSLTWYAGALQAAKK